jgi:hypothetical protein
MESRKVCLDLFKDLGGLPYEDATVPIKIPLLDKGLCCFQIRFF